MVRREILELYIYRVDRGLAGQAAAWFSRYNFNWGLQFYSKT